ncbi:MAG: SGNH/GDSL hydrolase family protein [Flavobacteriales bacterium]
MKKQHALLSKKISATLCMLSICLVSFSQVDSVSMTFSTTALTYQNDASNSDLLTGITPFTTGWNVGGGASVSQLTDGIHGDDYTVAGSTVEGAWTTIGATAEYNLGVGSNGTGYDLDSIVSIADWNGAGFGNQGWTIEVQPIGGAYTTLYTVDYQPLDAGSMGTTEVVLANSNGTITTGIEKIKITANSVNAGANGGAFVWRELDVFGSATDSSAIDSSATVPSSLCVLKIMPMGNSITAGYTDNPTWSHLFNFGYRGYLYTSLTNSGYEVQYQGSSLEPWNSIWGDPSLGGTYAPPFDLRTISQDNHHGYGGQTATFLNANIASWLAAEVPDIILLKVGTNAQDQAGANTLVNYITTNYPSIHVIIAQIIPKFSYQQGIVDYNNYIKNTLVPAYQALGKNVTTADLYAPFLTNPSDLTSIDVSLFSNGINHPNDDGYIAIAEAWENAINDLCLCVVGTDTRTECKSYEWIDGITYTENNSTATHNLVGASTNGCDSLVTLNLTINTANIGVTQNQADLLSDAVGANYQWLDCNNSMNVIPNDTNQIFSASINGSYAIEVEENGCIDTSSCLVVITVGMDESWDDPKITTHNNTITIKGKGTATIYNLTGQRVHHSKLTGNTSISLAKGIYLVRVIDEGRSITEKIYLQ